MSTCRHLWEARPAISTADGCAACLETGSTWVHLRQCLTCGVVGCCDQSPNRHASGHAASTGHPVARSAQPGESWRWCYVDELLDDPEELELEGADLG